MKAAPQRAVRADDEDVAPIPTDVHVPLSIHDGRVAVPVVEHLQRRLEYPRRLGEIEGRGELREPQASRVVVLAGPEVLRAGTVHEGHLQGPQQLRALRALVREHAEALEHVDEDHAWSQHGRTREGVAEDVLGHLVAVGPVQHVERARHVPTGVDVTIGSDDGWGPSRWRRSCLRHPGAVAGTCACVPPLHVMGPQDRACQDFQGHHPTIPVVPHLLPVLALSREPRVGTEKCYDCGLPSGTCRAERRRSVGLQLEQLLPDQAAVLEAVRSHGTLSTEGRVPGPLAPAVGCDDDGLAGHDGPTSAHGAQLSLHLPLGLAVLRGQTVHGA
mmetsp:Transcript_38183/g.110267  ORF Transcript_38183/g.110267 Transcript_38183/m.110267 type:complete len:330 (-) Transcript_38183:829-1818(-)